MSAIHKKISLVSRLKAIGSPGFGIVSYRRGGTLGPRVQGLYQLVVLHQGSVEISISGVTRCVSAKCGILLAPGNEEYFRFSATEEARHSWCQAFPWEISAGHRIPGWGLFRPAPCSPWLLDYMHRGLDLCGLTGAHAGHEARHFAVLTAFWEFLRGAGTALAEPDRLQPLPEPLRKAEAFIHENLAEPLKLVDLARAGRVSKGNLIKLSKTAWNTTPYERLWTMRLHRAAQLLRDTGLGVAEIAYQTGFANPYHFSRRFSQRYGLPPRAWRLRHWRGTQKEDP